jgi:hypothetical protein
MQHYIDNGMPMKLLAAGATSVSDGLFGKGPSMPGYQPRPANPNLPDTRIEDLPYWLKVKEGLLPAGGSAPLNPHNDKRGKRQGTENQAPIYNFNITVTGDVNAPLHLNAGQGSSSDL